MNSLDSRLWRQKHILPGAYFLPEHTAALNRLNQKLLWAKEIFKKWPDRSLPAVQIFDDIFADMIARWAH